MTRYYQKRTPSRTEVRSSVSFIKNGEGQSPDKIVRPFKGRSSDEFIMLPKNVSYTLLKRDDTNLMCVRCDTVDNVDISTRNCIEQGKLGSKKKHFDVFLEIS